MLKIALLALTMTADGELRMSVTETDGWVECAMQYERTAQLHKTMGTSVIETICGEHDLPMTKPVHVQALQDAPHRYRVIIGQNGRFRIDLLGERQLCVPSQDWPNKVYCARSAQTIDLDRLVGS